MKRIINMLPFVIGFILLGTFNLNAQKKGAHPHPHPHPHPHGKAHHNKVVVKKSIYRPAKVVVYHPYWGPKRHIYRRWVYFPKYNLYWDNWRNHYVFWNGSVWFSQATPPPVIVNINLDKEKHYELKEDEDDIDDVYKTNDTHKSEYKPE